MPIPPNNLPPMPPQFPNQTHAERPTISESDPKPMHADSVAHSHPEPEAAPSDSTIAGAGTVGGAASISAAPPDNPAQANYATVGMKAIALGLAQNTRDAGILWNMVDRNLKEAGYTITKKS